MRRHLLLLAVSLATCAAASAQGGPGGGKMPPTAVETVQLAPQSLSRSISAVGTLRANESVVVRPELAGKIEKVHFEEGQRVEQGAPLFTLDASLVRAEVREWEANVGKSERDATRAQELSSKRLIAQQDLDAKKSELAVNQARLSSAKTRLAKTVITAPFAGVVGLRQVSAGEYVEAGQALVDLVQLDPLKLEFRVPEIHLGKIAAGQAVAVELDAFPGEKFPGVVYAVDAMVDPQARNVALRATLDNDDGRLRPGLFARVSLELGSRDDALLVPEQALWPQGDKQFVYVVKEGKADLVEVTTGTRENGKVEIVKGLAPGATVITAGQLKIGPGSPVQSVPAPGAAPAKAPPAAAPAKT
ncbi:MAG TPA: efflux RND transporter periplasmic adaptor subunit [Xanthomonadales bacterium]|nr:efflux RND transporter periplasmic adaptor subunit [Xanthomonadales bacterium]